MKKKIAMTMLCILVVLLLLAIHKMKTNKIEITDANSEDVTEDIYVVSEE
ncbi:MAG: hypothetical protein MJ245_01630 [Clostridia bacterium]|nr:hypothetical protein [Clostridia bacterium]